MAIGSVDAGAGEPLEAPRSSHRRPASTLGDVSAAEETVPTWVLAARRCEDADAQVCETLRRARRNLYAAAFLLAQVRKDAGSSRDGAAASTRPVSLSRALPPPVREVGIR